jgi:K+-transporting ATPase ATPase C chain
MDRGMNIAQIIRPVLSCLLFYSVLLGFAYPAAVTAFARLAFPAKASGSVLSIGQAQVGSVLIGQPFTRPEFFWGRASATAPTPYNAAASAASNLGPLNPILKETVKARVAMLRNSDRGNTLPVPVDLVTTSGSGLDPHISPAAAFYQVSRVARLRGLPENVVRRLVEEHIESRLPGMFGEPRVNVLLLNLALKRMEKTGEK